MAAANNDEKLGADFKNSENPENGNTSSKTNMAAANNDEKLGTDLKDGESPGNGNTSSKTNMAAANNDEKLGTDLKDNESLGTCNTSSKINISAADHDEKLGSDLKDSESPGNSNKPNTLMTKISKFTSRQQEKISRKIKQSKEMIVSSASATSALVREKAAQIVESIQGSSARISKDIIIFEDTSDIEVDRARTAHYSSENIESDTKSGASQWYSEMSATLLSKISRFKQRQQEKISSSTFFKENKEKLPHSNSFVKEKTRNALTKNTVAPMPVEITEEDSQIQSNDTSLTLKVADDVIPLTPLSSPAKDSQPTVVEDVISLALPSSPVKNSQPTALDIELAELIKQSELLQQQLSQQLAFLNVPSEPEKIQNLIMPEPAAMSGGRRRVKRKRKISVPDLCGCVSASPDETKDVTSDSDYYSSVFVDNSDLKSPEEQLASTIDLGRDGLISEYMDIRNIPYNDTFKVAKLSANSSKNRYSDVLCYDKTRVVLEGDKSQDYINANFVNSFEQNKGYICCQGPLPRTITDFWRMVWQEKVCTIVMTTRLAEKGRTKCSVYWPQEVNSKEEYGPNFSVVNMNISKDDDIQKTTLCIYNAKTNETRFVTHLLFLKWPDYGIPSSPDAFLRLIVDVREAQAEGVKNMPEWTAHPRGPPIIVHCSAGVGRSGTFICADICIYMLDLLGKLNIEQVVKNIRTQRALAVQMPDQYVFCHQAILQYAQKKGMIPANVDIPEILKEEDE